MIKVFIDGSEGTTGLRIHERFAGRADVELIPIAPELRKDVSARADCMARSDVAFLCLPDAAALEAVSFAPAGVRIIDTSTAHRTAPGWAYGFPELSPAHRERIRTSDRVASPGCHASGFIALVYPLIAAGVLMPDAGLSCFSLTGYSGGGKKMIAQYEHDNRDAEMYAPRLYGLPQTHKHLREMQLLCGLQTPPVFSPIVADYYNGMLVSVPLHASAFLAPLTPAALTDLYRAHYANEPLVQVLAPREEGMLAGNARAGSDVMDVFVCGNAERLTLHASFDNLGKGASGAAIQCMNLMFGLAESTGLNV